MIDTCYNCRGARYVWNGHRNIACPVCGNRGVLERALQSGLFGGFTVYVSKIKPDKPVRRKHHVIT